jgi:hypothetical protein
VRTLVIHAGLPKTGTTTLQRDFFPELPGYLGGNSSVANSELFYTLRSLHAERPEKWATIEWHDRAIGWWEEAMRVNANDPLLVSSETLYSWGHNAAHYLFEGTMRPGGAFRPLVSFIGRLGEALKGRAQLRVILTVRNQPEFLASLYAQGSDMLPEPSQSDFESRVRALVASRDDFLNWGERAGALVDMLGSENVLIPIFEDGIDTLTQQMAAFIGVQPAAPPRIGRHNALGAGEASWTLRRRTIAHRILRLPHALWPVNIAPAQRRHLKVALGLNRLEMQLKRMVQAGEQKDSGRTITITPELRRAVREAWAESNSRLAGIVGRDLYQHGY